MKNLLNIYKKEKTRDIEYQLNNLPTWVKIYTCVDIWSPLHFIEVSLHISGSTGVKAASSTAQQDVDYV